MAFFLDEIALKGGTLERYLLITRPFDIIIEHLSSAYFFRF